MSKKPLKIPPRAVLDAHPMEWLETTGYVDPKTGVPYEPVEPPDDDDPVAEEDSR